MRVAVGSFYILNSWSRGRQETELPSAVQDGKGRHEGAFDIEHQWIRYGRGILGESCWVEMVVG